ncbi:hypothetical protein Amme3_00178 [Pseudomonas phage vB_PpuM-Amme-3]|uniref:Secreted protein n=1 Tax=Pseudomonas phage vB_PpuM-Amme-3 TaxID=3132617 RepID=A0AAX4MWP1_9CAUD
MVIQQVVPLLLLYSKLVEPVRIELTARCVQGTIAIPWNMRPRKLWCVYAVLSTLSGIRDKPTPAYPCSILPGDILKPK